MPSIKSLARSMAVLAFFAVAILSFIAGCSPDICCGRAVLGAVVAYCIVSWALRTILNIAFDALTATRHNKKRQVNYVGTDANR